MNESELRTRSMSSQPDANKPVRIVELKQTDTDAAAHIHLVAARMRQTLIEVLGQERGSAMYSLPWLVDRVEFHLDPARSTGAVLLALDGRDAAVIGHTIVRVEVQEECPRLGLFSTIYVVPEKRRAGVARALVAAEICRVFDGRAVRAEPGVNEIAVSVRRGLNRAGGDMRQPAVKGAGDINLVGGIDADIANEPAPRLAEIGRP